MRKIIIICILLNWYLYLSGQTPVGSWSDHLVYTTAKNIALGSKDIYASTGSSIMVYNRNLDELRKMSRINGLTETGINTIAWSEEFNSLIIAYSSTNVDLVQNNVIYNIPDIYRKTISGKKEINRIRTRDNYAYLACSFGIVVIDMKRREIYDTWKPGNGTSGAEVFDLAFGNGQIYAATGNGVYSADISNPGLSYFGNWSLVNILPDPTGKYTSLIFTGDKLYVNNTSPLAGGDLVYSYDGTSSLFSFVPGIYNTSFDIGSDGFTISSNTEVRYFKPSGELIKTIDSYGWGTPNIRQAIVDEGDIWIADLNSGLIRGRNMTSFSTLTLPGPASNVVIDIFSHDGKTISMRWCFDSPLDSDFKTITGISL